MQSSLRIAFIGGGNMASAMISGLVKQVASPAQIYVIDVNAENLQNLSDHYRVSTSSVMDARLLEMDVIVLAVKPQQLHAVAASLRVFVKTQLILSVAAGIRAADLSRWLGGHSKIVRAMPNTPAMIGLGMTGLYAMDAVIDEERKLAETMMQAVGDSLWVDNESMIDAVTAVSGSGPAYVFYFIEAMQEAAMQLGFDATQARQLALSTFNGAAQLAKQSEESVSSLRERVTSKGGTTYAALCSMDDSAVKAAIHQAVQAAALRGKELGDEFGRH